MANRLIRLALGGLVALMAGCSSKSVPIRASLSFKAPGSSQPKAKATAAVQAAASPPASEPTTPRPTPVGSASPMPTASPSATPVKAPTPTPVGAPSGLPAPTASPTQAPPVVLMPDVPQTLPVTLPALKGPFIPADGATVTSPVALVAPALAGGNWVDITINHGADGKGGLAYQARYPVATYKPPVNLAPGVYSYVVVSELGKTAIATSPAVVFTVKALAL